jgi:hypothetical protein
MESPVVPARPYPPLAEKAGHSLVRPIFMITIELITLIHLFSFMHLSFVGFAAGLNGEMNRIQAA